ncbi:ribose 5-phosphate isomerase B [Polymorphobacter glacialis]|uniref:Ribose 5-phosphate isomerase B n=1 Tax=Sandarakinorhabdus glacialis TaxID=1614636 RepID=A0A917ED13_9SPHN|nr:ribose 5-phosphate isomerase B [Polymorphobacter glacialis]GGE20602.1 ribose 5-phosphate isomerase B [Polymorphobacter glacialis]
MTFTIAFASDHAGVAMKAMLIDEVRGLGHAVVDLGPSSEASVDYPDYGEKLGQAIADGRARLGVAICGSGIGISIAANRNPAVRAALCTSGLMARLARQHNDANVLALGSRIVGPDTARDCLTQFLAASFAGGRHAGRVAKLTPGYQEDVVE